jgi:hypothetical protein
VKTKATLITSANEERFLKSLVSEIDMYERAGYVVEVHYGNPAALVIGRVPKHPEIESGIRFSPPLS